MSKTVESRSVVAKSREHEPGPEKRLSGEEATEGYHEFAERHEQVLELYISLGTEDMDDVTEFLVDNSHILLEGEHAETYLLLDCLEKEMNGEHEAMLKSARQSQLLTQLREFSRSTGRPVRDGIRPLMERLMTNEELMASFEESTASFVDRIEKRAVVKKKEMDEEEENEQGPGGPSPLQVLRSLPPDMQAAFEKKDMQQLQAAIEALPLEEAQYHLKRCEECGLWVRN